MSIRFVFILVFLSADAFACSWVGDPPRPEDHIVNFERSVIVFEVIFRGKVISVKGNVATIQVDEIFKGAKHLQSTIQYEPSTSCDQYFSDEGEDSLFFGGLLQGQINVPAGNGVVRSDSGVFPELLRQLQVYASSNRNDAA